MKLNKLIFGNWKMNMLADDVELFGKTFSKLITKDKKLEKCQDIEYGVAPTFMGILPALNFLGATPTIIGAQNISTAEKGAYTSQISYQHLIEFGVDHVILGHSEVRQYLHETDEIINQKTLLALEKGMTPLLCIGETEQEYEANKTIDVLTKQLELDTKGVKQKHLENLVIAYEPIWAIGTGKSAQPEDIKNIFIKIREILIKIFGEEAQKVRILYGGSLNNKNAESILAIEEVNGGLIGGASMDANNFYDIITKCPEYKNCK